MARRLVLFWTVLLAPRDVRRGAATYDEFTTRLATNGSRTERGRHSSAACERPKAVLGKKVVNSLAP